jgi:hypothetical protein
MGRQRNPEYIYKEDAKGRVLAYKQITCAFCGKQALSRVAAKGRTGRFCNHACAVSFTHAQGNMPAVPRGEESPYWKGGDATYSGMHKRVVRHRGPADHCEQRETVGCRSLTYQWAWIHDTDPSDPQNYRQLCRTCHVAYDGQVGAGNARAKLTQEDADAIRARYAKRGARGRSPYRVLAAEYGVTIATISNIVLGRRYSEDRPTT